MREADHSLGQRKWASLNTDNFLSNEKILLLYLNEIYIIKKSLF